MSGWDVTLVEAIFPGHVRAGSGDESRIIRCGHGADEWHTASARRAWALWHEIDPALVVPSGVLWLAHGEDGWEAASERTLRALRIPCSRVDPREMFPAFAGDDVGWGLFEPEAGVVRARDATRVLAEQALAAGASLQLAAARPSGAGVALDDGRVLEADRVVWACGAWLPRLFEGLELRITQQDVFYFGASAAWRTPGVPTWVDYDEAAYGVGDVDGRGVKVCSDREGPTGFDVDGDRVPVRAHEARARGPAAGRSPVPARRPPGGAGGRGARAGGGAIPGARARPPGRHACLPVRADGRHALPRRAASVLRQPRLAARRRLGARLQARAGARRARRALDLRRGGTRADVRPRRARGRPRAADRGLGRPRVVLEHRARLRGAMVQHAPERQAGADAVHPRVLLSAQPRRAHVEKADQLPRGMEGVGDVRPVGDAERGPQLAVGLRDEKVAGRQTRAVELREAAEGRGVVLGGAANRDGGVVRGGHGGLLRVADVHGGGGEASAQTIVCDGADQLRLWRAG